MLLSCNLNVVHLVWCCLCEAQRLLSWYRKLIRWAQDRGCFINDDDWWDCKFRLTYSKLTMKNSTNFFYVHSLCLITICSLSCHHHSYILPQSSSPSPSCPLWCWYSYISTFSTTSTLRLPVYIMSVVDAYQKAYGTVKRVMLHHGGGGVKRTYVLYKFQLKLLKKWSEVK